MLRSTLSTLLLGAVLLLAGPAGFGQSPVYAQTCISQSQAQALVASGQARPFSAFYGSLQQRGKVVSSCMIQSNGVYRYVVKLITADGNVIQLTVGP